MIEKIMTKNIIYLDCESTVKEASSKMLRYDIGFLPITNKEKVIGVLTDRDIATTILENTNSLDSSIESYVIKRVVTCNIKDSLEDVLKIMKKEKVKRVIVEDNKKIVGIISFSDIMHHYNDYENLINTLKDIFTINRNTDEYRTEIDEFYL